MPVQLIHGPGARRPAYRFGVDWGNPITFGLAFAFDAACGKRDLVTGATGGASGSGIIQRSNGLYGPQTLFNGAQGDNGYEFGVHRGLFGATGTTFDVLVYFATGNQTANFFGQWDGTDQNFLLQASSGSLVWVAADDTASGSNRTRFDLSSAFTSAGWYRIIAAWRGGTDRTLIINRVERSASVVQSNATAVSTATVDKISIGKTVGGSALNGNVVFARAWRRGLGIGECRALSDSLWIIHPPETIPLFWSSNPPQIVYPTGDVAGGAWLPSTGTDLYACIDETAASDADYIYTTVPGAYQEFYFPNCGAVDPSTGGHVRYRIPAGTGTITAILKQGSTTLQTLGTHTLTGSAQDIDITIAASVANSDNLRVGFTASA